VTTQIRCDDDKCDGSKGDIGGLLRKIAGGFKCPFCRGVRFRIIDATCEPAVPGKCFKCGGATVSGSVCDTCLKPALDELHKPVEPGKGKLFKTVIEVIVLSEDAPYNFQNLNTLWHDINYEHFVGSCEDKPPVEVSVEQMDNLLAEAGNDGEFFKHEPPVICNDCKNFQGIGMDLCSKTGLPVKADDKVCKEMSEDE
jgi:hypothetical protein